MLDDDYRLRFEETLQEVEKSGWALYVWVLMNNHYHLALKTPEPNMVKGMGWFQAVGTLPLLFENNERWAIGKGRNQCLVHPISRLKAVLLLRQNRRMPQLILSFLALACSLSASAQSQPNFVFIIADDLGWADVEFHGGNTPTPNLDQLLAEGIELKQHYVAPVCSATWRLETHSHSTQKSRLVRETKSPTLQSRQRPERGNRGGWKEPRKG